MSLHVLSEQTMCIYDASCVGHRPQEAEQNFTASIPGKVHAISVVGSSILAESGTQTSCDCDDPSQRGCADFVRLLQDEASRCAGVHEIVSHLMGS